jgi:rare lipoprotein A
LGFDTCRKHAFLLALAAFGATAILPMTEASAASQCGRASWYKSGTRTASGERMNAGALAAAHRTLPFGTRVRVDNLANGRSVVVRINDRGPFIKGRVIDVTRAAALQLGMVGTGVASVRLTVLSARGQLPSKAACR